ncbi:MAG: ion channel [Cetobacterium sp.]|uniref:ion channel n=1 Tax=unclassified Cetobacterium TaxID=2630983 RepID=UPI00163C2391|nr:ion channel [Cetobacterium sp. 2A]MBC2856407.1 hypothetical protein [Cetobacterium sp. 2A]
MDEEWKIIRIVMSVLPILFLARKNLVMKDGPLKASFLIIYYSVFLPILNLKSYKYQEESLGIFGIVIAIINVGFLIASHVVLIKYTFTDLFLRKRKIVARDILIVITTYITLAISFGFIYAIVSLSSSQPVFYGMPPRTDMLHFYFKHMYFSFITIATVGFGDVYPLTMLAEFLVVLEVLVGVVIVNITLALIVGSGIFNLNEEKNGKNK